MITDGDMPHRTVRRESCRCRMSDPVKLDASDWLAATVTGVVAGVGGAMAWFAGSKNKLTARMDAQEVRMNIHTEKHFSHETQLAVIHTNQDHLSHRLDEIRECTRDTNDKITTLTETVTQILMVIKRR